MTNYHLMHGDCLEELPKLPENKADAIVTDPPYGLAFMGKSWDQFDPKELQEFTEEWASGCLRVLKPGGHLLTFGGTRTFHRIASGVEDAGFEIRDCLSWHYGSGFPKSQDMSKAIDKRKNADREVVGKKEVSRDLSRDGKKGDMAISREEVNSTEVDVTAPATDEAKQWDGYGTALKPSWEPIILARAPLSEDTIVDNVLEHDVGALNIDGCRIDSDRDPQSYTVDRWKSGAELKEEGGNWKRDGEDVEKVEGEMPSGRFPANTVLSHTRWCNEDGDEMDCPPSCPVRMMDESSGERPTGDSKKEHSASASTAELYGEYKDNNDSRWQGDSGGASRFFYTGKATTSEREMGMDEGKCSHPTVKPLDLIRWLIKLITPMHEDEQSVVLDPFTGSGTTGIAVAQLRGKTGADLKFLGVEKSDEYIDMCKKRVYWAFDHDWKRHFTLQAWQEFDGIGEKRSEDVLDKLGPVETADLSELESVSGIGEKTANKIREEAE